MTINEFLNIDLSKLTKADIEKIAPTIQGLVNRSLRTWETKESKSPAARELTKSGGKISITKNMNLNLQKKELARARRFLSDKTRTQKGWDKVKRDIIRKVNTNIKAAGGKQKIKFSDFDDFWNAYNRAKELKPDIDSDTYKYNVMDTILDELAVDDKETDEIAVDISEAFNQIVEERERSNYGDGGVSRFFR